MSMQDKLGDLMKQAQQFQEDVESAQKKLADKEVTGESGGGLVKVTINCKHDFKRVEIDSSLMSEDKEALEDLIAAAANQAIREAEAAAKTTMADVASAFKLPDMPNFPLGKDDGKNE